MISRGFLERVQLKKFFDPDPIKSINYPEMRRRLRHVHMMLPFPVPPKRFILTGVDIECPIFT